MKAQGLLVKGYVALLVHNCRVEAALRGEVHARTVVAIQGDWLSSPTQSFYTMPLHFKYLLFQKYAIASSPCGVDALSKHRLLKMSVIFACHLSDLIFICDFFVYL